MIANLLTLFVAVVVSSIVIALDWKNEQMKRERRTKEQPSADTIRGSEKDDNDNDADNNDDDACEKCLGIGQHSGSRVDPKLIRLDLLID